MESKPKRRKSRDVFRNLDGSLSVYAFACGYIERALDVRLFKDGDWQVRWDFGWESFNSLGEARKYFRMIVKQKKNNINETK